MEEISSEKEEIDVTGFGDLDDLFECFVGIISTNWVGFFVAEVVISGDEDTECIPVGHLRHHGGER